jgi:hypothetical protein
MMNGYYAEKNGKMIYLETADKTAWYHFYTFPVKKSNVDNTVVGYQCCIESAQRGCGGSSHNTRYVSKTDGNNTYKFLLSKGLVKVDKPSFA